MKWIFHKQELLLLAARGNLTRVQGEEEATDGNAEPS